MKKALVVSYTPRQESNTKKLLELFLAKAKQNLEITVLDLVVEPADPLGSKSITAYAKRNLARQEISAEESAAVARMDELTEQVTNSDYLVLAFPIYNYFLPGPVKTWIDNITQAGKAFKSTEYGPEGLWKGKHGLVINTSSSTPKESARDFSTPYLKFIFNYWGFTSLTVDGVFALKYTGLSEEKLAEFAATIDKVLADWEKA